MENKANKRSSDAYEYQEKRETERERIKLMAEGERN